MCGGKPRVHLDRATAVRRGGLQIAKLQLGQAKFEIDVGGGLGASGGAELGCGSGEVLLLRVDARQKAMSTDVGGIDRSGGGEFLDGSGLLAEIEPGGAESVMGVGPFGLEAQRSLELFHGLLRFAFVFERQSQVVVSGSITGFEFEGLLIVGDRVIPRFVARKFDGLLAIGFGGWRLSER
jgi:hypothetical protein